MGTLINSFLSPFFKFFSLIRSFIVYKIRVDGLMAINFYDLIMKNGKVFALHEEFVKDSLPRQFDAYGIYQKIPFSFSVNERLLRAGMTGIDYVINISFFRIHKKRFKNILKSCIEEIREEIPIYLLGPWHADKIGKLSNVEIPDEPYLNPTKYLDLEKRIKNVITNKEGKTGAILHGPPGNGKSFLVRYFAIKYSLPIYVIVFNNDMNNTDLIKMFSKIEGPSIVLLEDFDNHFDCRQPLIPNTKFSFDTILNSLDGIFTNYKGVVFFMTANNIDKIDFALKYRPSRFEYVIEINNPDEEIRSRIFNKNVEDNLINKTNGYSLDMLLYIKDRIKAGRTEKEAFKDMKTFDIYLQEQKQKFKELEERNKEDEDE